MPIFPDLLSKMTIGRDLWMTTQQPDALFLLTRKLSRYFQGNLT